MKTTRQTKHEAKQLFRLCLVNGLVDEDRTRQVAQRIMDGKRRGYLGILAQFQRLVRLAFARHAVEVESAVPLPEDLRNSIQAGLTRVYGPGVRPTFAHNPGLIGGIRIKVGSDVYDGSVRARLTELEKRF